MKQAPVCKPLNQEGLISNDKLVRSCCRIQRQVNLLLVLLVLAVHGKLNLGSFKIDGKMCEILDRIEDKQYFSPCEKGTIRNLKIYHMSIFNRKTKMTPCSISWALVFM